MSQHTEQCIEYVSSVGELQLNCLYRDPSTSEEWSQEDEGFTIKEIPHCLSLRLLHIFGPYDHHEWQCAILLLAVSCVHDPEHRIMVFLRPDDQQAFPSKPITLDLINCTFTLKNFLTIQCKAGLTFGQECPIVTDYNFAIFASTKYNSTLKFYGDVIHDNNNEDVNLDNESIYSAATAMSINDFVSEEDILMTDDDSDLRSLTDHLLPKPTTSSISSRASTPKIQTMNAEDTVMPSTSKGLRRGLRDSSPHNNSTNATSNNVPLPSLESEVNEIIVPEENIQEVLALIDKKIKDEFNVEPFVRKNISHINFDETIDLTSFSDMVYPSNSMQSYQQANVVGVLSHLPTLNEGQSTELYLYDEKTEKFPVKLGFKSISSVINGPIDDVSIFKDYKKHNKEYPNMMIGNIICIRKLCLSLRSTNICVHPDQLTLVDVNQTGGLMSTWHQRKLSVKEFVRVVELACRHANELANPEAKRYFTHKVINLAGQYLGSRRKDPYMQVYILLPSKTHAQSYLGDAGLYIWDNIEAFDISPQKLFTKEKIQKLIANNHIILATIYDKHRSIFTDRLVQPLDLVVLYNLHIKEDKFYPGYSQFILHGGTDFGRHCAKVDPISIFGLHILNSLDCIHKELNVDPNMISYLEDYQANLDDRVLSHMGENAKQLIKNLNKNDKILPDVVPCLSKSIIKHVIQPYSMFQPHVSIKSAKLVESISDMVKDTESQLFRLPARLVDYYFEDNKNNSIKNMGQLRNSLLKIVCTAKHCDFVLPFKAFLSRTAAHIAGSGEQLTCPKKHPVAAYLPIQLTLQDNSSKRHVVFISSPETEELIGCSNNQLIYTDPLSDDICRAFQYVFKSLCPKPQRMTFYNTQEGHSELDSDFPLFHWILECSIANVKTFSYEEFKCLHFSYLQNNPELAETTEIREFPVYRVRALCCSDS